ncbi:MAG TPA: alpha-glucosidase [Chitinophagaceae bacterium]|nr:alpha-glucosidase [Chitinophagaceae bacterium]
MKQHFFFCCMVAIIAGLSCGSPGTEKTAESASVDSTEKKWWKEAVVYQLYPRSFQDSDGDGVGDIKGITQRLDYLQSLGIHAIWLNPIFTSPNDDNGYDISDYRGIMKEMGTMQDFDSMLAGMHRRGIKLIMDLVLNHSSDEHEWFQQSRSSRTNPYRNYYHWWPAERGTPPKRFSLFDEEANAWRYDSLTNSYYLHYFSRKQPDLNWENPKLRQEIYDMMKFWLEKGVDGFRLDAFPFMSKDTSFPALPAEYNGNYIPYYGKGPYLHDYLQEMNREILSKYDIMTVGEGGVIEFKEVLKFIDEDRKEINTLYHSEHVDSWARRKDDISIYDSTNKDLIALKKLFGKWDSLFARKGWNTVYFGNHDHSRALSRFGNDKPAFREPSAKMLFTFLLTQRATPYLYWGDEIGMSNIRFKTVEEYNDLATRNTYNLLLRESKEKAERYLLSQAELSRDNSRTPMQWNAGPNAGFTSGKPWLAINPNYTTVNVEAAEKDKNSILHFVRSMIKLRDANKDVLVYGKYTLVDDDNPAVYAYTRENKGRKFLVLLNFTDRAAAVNAGFDLGKAKRLLGNYASSSTGNQLQPYEAIVYEL